MAGMGPVQGSTSGPNFQALGVTPSMVIDTLAAMSIDGEPVIKDDRAFTDPTLKAQAVMDYFNKKFGVPPQELPYLVSVIKKDMLLGNIDWRG